MGRVPVSEGEKMEEEIVGSRPISSIRKRMMFLAGLVEGGRGLRRRERREWWVVVVWGWRVVWGVDGWKGVCELGKGGVNL